MFRGKLQFLVVIGVIFSSLTGLLGVRTQTFAETSTKILVDESFLKVSYDASLTEEGNVFQIQVNREDEGEQKQRRLKLKLLTEDNETVDYPMINGMEKKDDWLCEKKFTSSANYDLSIVLPKKEKKLQLFVELNEQSINNQTDENSADDSEKEVLGLKGPLLLEVEKAKEPKTSKSKKTSSSNSVGEEKSTTGNSFSLYSEQNSLSPLAGLKSRNFTPSRSYTNKVPSYKKDKGEYPEYSWQPTGQSNVINHQGGKDNTAADVWDGLQSWDTSTDNYTNSYIYYGVGEKEEGDIALRKYATETAKKDEFNVRLNVRGDSLTKPGVDVMFVLDNSASMIFPESQYRIDGRLRKDVSVDSLRGLITQFKNNVPDNLGYLRLGGVVFGSDVISTSDLSAKYSDWDQLVTKYQTASTLGHQTYTQGGLIEAQKRLMADNTGRRKVIFLLTDGAPNRSRKPTAGKSDAAIFPSKVRVTNYVTSEAGDHLQSNGSTSLYVLNTGWEPPIVDRTLTITNAGGGAALKINSHLDMTNSQAADLRDSGIEIQAIAMGTYGGAGEYHSPADLIKGLYKMTTQRSNTTGDSEKDYYFFQAQDLKDFEESFQDWFESTLTTVENGVIEDPLGDMVELVGTPTVKDVSLENGLGTKAINADRMAVADNSNARKIRVTNINLYGNQEIEINYKVRLKTADDSFVSANWYPANGKTTLQVSPDRTLDILDFGVPSVRAINEDFVIPVKKVWSNDKYDYWLKRQEITAVLQKKVGENWSDLHQIPLNATNEWENSFPAVDRDPDITYRVIERVDNVGKVPGYEKPSYSQDSFRTTNLDVEGIIITNRLMTTDYSFKKVMEDNQPFSGSEEELPKFTLTEKTRNIEIAVNVAPNTAGIVSFEDLPIGTYRVSETVVPKGYQKMDDFEFSVTENADGTAVIADSTNKTIINKLNDFKLIVVKQNEQGAEIEGAVFRLRNSSGTYNKTVSSGSTFSFSGLKSELHFLKEVTAPASYVGLEKEIAVDIFESGYAAVENHPLVTSTVELGETENLITVKVKNKRQVGALPKTGSFGNRYFVLFSSICLVVGSGLGAIYLYINRRRG